MGQGEIMGRMLYWLRGLVPALLPALVWFALPAWREAAPQVPALFLWLPFAALAVAAIPAWLFNRNRVAFAALVVAGAWWAQTQPAPVALAAAFLAPLNLAVLAWLRERGLLSPHGLLRLGLLGLQALAVWLAYRYSGGTALSWLEAAWLPLPDLLLPQALWLAFAVGAVAIGGRFLRRREALDGALLYCLGAVLAGVLAPAQAPPLVAAAGLALFLGLTLDSHSMAYRDELTGLPGRRALNERLDALGRRYVVAMVDVDHFKRFNDTYGHDVGDQVLRMVAARLRTVSGGGQAFRYGGEEFTVLFPGRGLEEAEPHLEALRGAIERYALKLRDQDRPKGRGGKRQRGKGRGGDSVGVTVSMGLAERGAELRRPEEVIKAADQALYRAKKAGRNRLAR